MPNWLIAIIIAAVIFGFIGFINAKDGNRGQDTAMGAAAGAMGCGYIILQIAIGLFSLWVLFAIGSWLFG